VLFLFAFTCVSQTKTKKDKEKNRGMHGVMMQQAMVASTMM
jgi:hypothetical protein